MSIFTQVWLWSVAAFAIGALLTVLLLVLPARKQVKELQRQLTEAEAAPREPTRQFPPEAPPTAEPTRTFQPEPDSMARTGYQPAFEPKSSAAGYQRSAEPEASAAGYERSFEPESSAAGYERSVEPDSAATGYQPEFEADSSATRYQRPFESESSATGYQRPFEAEPEPEAQTATGYQSEFEAEPTRTFEPERATGYQPAFEAEPTRTFEPERATGYQSEFEAEPTRTFEPEPAATGYQPAFEPESSATGYQPAFGAEPEPEPAPVQSDIELRSHYEDDAPEHESVEQSWFSRQQAAEETRYYNGSGVLDDDRPGSLFTPAPEDELPSYEEELATERTQVLPKRQPRPAQPGGFDAPQPIEPSVRQVERREPAPEHGQNSGSLFEPAVPPGGNGGIPEPPPAREFEPELSVPVGPFGPGSAMPKPGGGRPTDEFSVKASVTALRYCTEDSPQFPRMVAEVWFRSAADAERVGFRPLG